MNITSSRNNSTYENKESQFHVPYSKSHPFNICDFVYITSLNGLAVCHIISLSSVFYFIEECKIHYPHFKMNRHQCCNGYIVSNRWDFTAALFLSSICET